MKQIILMASMFVLLSFTLVSCIKEPISRKGDIYLRIVSNPDVSYYDDNNDAVPYGFVEGVEYGPCDEGTYTYSFKTITVNGTYWYINNDTYELEAPINKSKRIYTLSLGQSVSITYNDY